MANTKLIDLTFATIYRIVASISLIIGRCSFQYDSEFNENMVYHPQLVGEVYFVQIGVFVDFGTLMCF